MKNLILFFAASLFLSCSKSEETNNVSANICPHIIGKWCANNYGCVTFDPDYVYRHEAITSNVVGTWKTSDCIYITVFRNSDNHIVNRHHIRAYSDLALDMTNDIYKVAGYRSHHKK